MFRGESSISLDAKGRFAVPTRYRERLSESCGGKLVVTISLMDRCLAVYPYPEWQRVEDKINGLPSLDDTVRTLRHLLVGHANECELDSHGRLLLPPLLREFAGIEKRMRMIGQVRHFELWDETAWNARREDLLAKVGTLQSSGSDALRELVL